jgi:hypothetical protein
MRVTMGVATALALGTAAGSLQDSQGEQFRLSFSLAEGIEFPFETNAEAGGGGCAPPKRHGLDAGATFDTCIPLKPQEIAVETEANRITVDTNGDGKPDEVIKGTAGAAVIQVRHGEEEPVRYGVRFFGDGTGVWTYDRWGYMSGKVRGVNLVLIDENANGLYNDFGKDRMVVGDGTQAHPLSDVVNLDGALHTLDVSPSGTSVRVRPYVGETGTLDLTTQYRSKGKLISAVVKGGRNWFDVGGKGPVTLPVGDYRLFSGVVAAAPQLAHLKQGEMKSFAVEPAKTTTLEWGLPVAIHFEHSFRDETVSIQPDRIHVRGGTGEEYFAFKPMAFTPTVVVRDMRSDAVVQKGTMVLG